MIGLENIIVKDKAAALIYSGHKTEFRQAVDKSDLHVPPYGSEGDLIFVRERFKPGYDHDPDNEQGPLVSVIYSDGVEAKVTLTNTDSFVAMADSWLRLFSSDANDYEIDFSSAEIMLPYLCRSVLKVVSVYKQSLNQITCSACRREGVGGSLGCHSPKEEFVTLWESINGVGSWESKPAGWGL